MENRLKYWNGTSFEDRAPEAGEFETHLANTTTAHGVDTKADASVVAAHLAQKANVTDDVHNLITDGKVIEESGSNANGEYIRFSDGTQICWSNISVSATAETYLSQNFSLPASFIVNPSYTQTVSIRAQPTTSTTIYLLALHASSASTVGLRLRSSSSGNHFIAYQVMGRWK